MDGVSAAFHVSRLAVTFCSSQSKPGCSCAIMVLDSVAVGVGTGVLDTPAPFYLELLDLVVQGF